MQTIQHIEILEKYILQCTFGNGCKKIVDLSDYLKSQAFLPLLLNNAFNKVTNKKYFIEWADYELDLSADTLWHIGKEH